MASTSSTATDPSTLALPDDMATKALSKRYEGLVTVRNKAIKGKGAWYWTHLEPVLIRNPDTDLPKASKLKCSLCDAVFSASNPSRTASEHLKKGACPNFSSVSRPSSASLSPLPISSVPSSFPSLHNHRKRSSQMVSHPLHSCSSSSYQANSLALVESSRFYQNQNRDGSNCSPRQNPVSSASNLGLYQHHLVLSGGKEDLDALALLEDSVKKLKSPKGSAVPALSKDQIDLALQFLAEWFYESCGSVSVSSLDHPKFRAFLNQISGNRIHSVPFLALTTGNFQIHIPSG
ncbi:hypothetical protein CJ030_MR6G019785 [Morella rubra]|uniref:DUF7963 domain-containing protein n=1 Tax=Morella rubra TaxID=262757 RepID=A0A6A1V5R9_9ROSI|nr:hypothetical protein CJ030_MR7G012974 [Morella rubra]KAB1210824.1 hypothetical protein CJ030_MR6G019785 [Morella rubra]